MKKGFLTLMATSALFIAAGQPVLAEQVKASGVDATPLSSMPDQAHVILSGIVSDVRDDEFDLKYETNTITVELDNFGWTEAEMAMVRPGQKMVVEGFIDDDLFEGREIEAFGLNIYDDYMYYYTTDRSPSLDQYYSKEKLGAQSTEDGAYVVMTGTVSGINGTEFMLKNGNKTMQVDTGMLGYDPYDDEGLQKISNGDRVHVYGEIDDGFFENKEIMAQGVVKLVDSGKNG